MRKADFIYRWLAYEVIDGSGSTDFTQLALAKKFGLSTSTVSNALKPLEGIGAVQVRRSGFRIVDLEKLLLYWASTRSLSKDVVRAAAIGLPVREVERSLPGGVVFTAYTGFKRKYGEAPADYDRVYAYADEAEIKEIMKRLPTERKQEGENLFLLRKDGFLEETSARGNAPAGVLFVDLWNLREWYAHDFVKALEKKLVKWFE